MFQKFYPSEDIRSTYDIDFERYYQEGYRGVIFDVDNTLVPHNAPADERAKKLFKRLDAIGMQYCFTSNNKEPRVKLSAKRLVESIMYTKPISHL